MVNLKLNTPKEMPKVEILEQTPERIISRFEYTNGLIIISTITAGEEVNISCNYTIVLHNDGTADFDMTKPNDEFRDLI